MAKRGRMQVAPRKKTPLYRPVKGKFGAQAFPKQLFNTMRYVDLLSIPQTGGLGKWLLSCNGIFDVNITGTGGQPQYFDQLTAVYDHYTVLKSKAKFTLMSTSSQAVNYTVYIDDDTTTSSNAYQAAMFDTAKTVLSGKQGDTVTLYSSWDAAKMFGPNPQAQDSLQGTSAANPTEQSYYTLLALDVGSASGNYISCLVEIDYYCVWDEYVTTPAS